MKKFELTEEFVTNSFGNRLFRIRALEAFGNVKAGEVGGFLEKEENLAQDGTAWVYGDAEVWGDAKVCGNAKVWGDAKVCGDAEVYENAKVCGDTEVCGDADVCGNAEIYGNLDYTYIHGFGSEQRTTTFYRQKDGTVGVKCGCFTGNLQEFREKVKETHRSSKYAEEYLMIADLMELHFKEEQENG